MPSKAISPRQAARRYLETIQQAASCITDAVIVASGYRPSERAESARLAKGDPVQLAAQPPISLSILLTFRAFQDLQAGWAVATAAYSYAIRDETGREILAYHWHPEQRVQFPHLHLGPGTLPGSSRLQKLHLPTGYVSLPDVIEVVITQLRVRVRRSDWREVLENTRRTDVQRGNPALTGIQPRDI